MRTVGRLWMPVVVAALICGCSSEPGPTSVAGGPVDAAESMAPPELQISVRSDGPAISGTTPSATALAKPERPKPHRRRAHLHRQPPTPKEVVKVQDTDPVTNQKSPQIGDPAPLNPPDQAPPQPPASPQPDQQPAPSDPQNPVQPPPQ